MEVQMATDASAATQLFALGWQAPLGERARSLPLRAEIDARTKIEARNDVRPRTADYEMKPMLGDESEAQIPRASFAAEDARARDRQAAVAPRNEAEESGATEEEATGGRTTRVGRPRGGMRVAARIGDRLRREIARGRRPRVGDG